MYSSEKNPGINWKDLVVKAVFFVIFILILMWLFPKVPNMTAFYSNVFRENISYMQEAAKSYYTNERLPKNVGDIAELTLQDMIDRNLIIPFVDKDGNPCDTYESYVQVTKESTEEYSLKVNLVCETESSYIIEPLGCYDYCESDECDDVKEEKPTEEDVVKQTQYQFRKAYTVDQTSTNCKDSTYNKLINGLCYNTEEAETSHETSDKLLDAVKNISKVQVPYDCSSVDSSTVCSTKYKYETQTQTYPCTKYKPQQNCTRIYEKVPYKCDDDCTTSYVGGKYTYSCKTCYKTVPKRICSNVQEPYQTTCTRQVVVKVPYEDCNEYTSSTPKICYKTEERINYTCPEGTLTQIGNGENLKCYATIETEISNQCKSGYTYNSSLKLCVSTNYKKPSTSVNKVTKYKYTWSTSTTLDGWERTGKTRTVQI